MATFFATSRIEILQLGRPVCLHVVNTFVNQVKHIINASLTMTSLNARHQSSRRWGCVCMVVYSVCIT